MAGRNIDVQVEEQYTQLRQEQEEIVQELGQALQGVVVVQRSPDDDQKLAHAVDKAVQHYHNYYRLTGVATISQRKHTLLIGSTVISAVERAFMWMGGQRPSMAFQLVYALMGHQIQAELEELLELGNSTVDGRVAASLASLSASQLTRLNDLHTTTMKEEDRIERELAKLQQSLADQAGLHLGGEFTRASLNNSRDDDMISAEVSRSSNTIFTQQDSSNSLNEKLASLQELCEEADDLRVSTFDGVLEVLHASLQKAQYLQAATKLQVALRNVGHISSSRHP